MCARFLASDTDYTRWSCYIKATFFAANKEIMGSNFYSHDSLSRDKGVPFIWGLWKIFRERVLSLCVKGKQRFACVPLDDLPVHALYVTLLKLAPLPGQGP